MQCIDFIHLNNEIELKTFGPKCPTKPKPKNRKPKFYIYFEISSEIKRKLCLLTAICFVIGFCGHKTCVLIPHTHKRE